MSKVNRFLSALVVLALVGVIQATGIVKHESYKTQHIEIPGKTFAIVFDWSLAGEYYNNEDLGTFFNIDVGGCVFNFETSTCKHYKKKLGGDAAHFKINDEDIFIHDKTFVILVSEQTGKIVLHRVDTADVGINVASSVPTYDCKPHYDEQAVPGKFVVKIVTADQIYPSIFMEIPGKLYNPPTPPAGSNQNPNQSPVANPSTNQFPKALSQSNGFVSPTLIITTQKPMTEESSPDCKMFTPLAIGLFVAVGVLVLLHILSCIIIGLLCFRRLQKNKQMSKDKSSHQKTENTVGGTSTTVGKSIETQKTVGDKEVSAFNHEVPSVISRPEIAAPTSAKK